MTADKSVDLQGELYQRLMAELATSGPDGGQLVVRDHAPKNQADASAPYVRLEAFNLIPERTKTSRPQQHRFTARVFDGDGSGALAARGQIWVKGIGAQIVAALEDWRPFAGGNAIMHLGTQIAPEDSAGGYSAICRFQIRI